MSAIEENFWDAHEDFLQEIERLCEKGILFHDVGLPTPGKQRLNHAVVIGPYKVDFTYGICVVELDGHEYHKTKEQRDYDYKRERYLQRCGHIVIRFTGTEVFLDARKCVIDMIFINNLFQQKLKS